MIRPPAPDDARRLRDDLIECRYTEEGLLDLLGIVDSPSPHLRNLPRLLDATRDPTALNVLAHWFLIGVPVPRATADRLLPRRMLDIGEETGLLVERGGQISSPVLMVPVGRLFVASDPFRYIDSEDGFRHVLTINPAARSLMDFTARRPSRSTLDLCTGSGIHALSAAPHSDSVVATDLNPRATAFAAFNAALNGFENIECVTGDAFSPVAGRTFDLIICNPPFILGPSNRFLYRDNDLPLDEFCRHLVGQAAAHLEDGGLFQMLCEWAEIEDEPWTERISSWFEGTGCDAWVVADYVQTPRWYAQSRLRETPLATAEADTAVFEEWMAYYAKHRVRNIRGGFIAMRRRGGRNWLRVEELVQKPTGAFGDSILRGFAARDFLEANESDERMLEARPRLAPEVILGQRYRCDESRWRTQSIVLELSKGLPRTTPLEGDIAEFLARFDGSRTLRELIRELAAGEGVDPARAETESLRIARRLVEQGILLP